MSYHPVGEEKAPMSFKPILYFSTCRSS